MEEIIPGVSNRIISYVIGLDSLKATSNYNDTSFWNASDDIRLRMDGLFEQKELAVQFSKEFTALYTNGPAGGGGIRSNIFIRYYTVFIVKLASGSCLPRIIIKILLWTCNRCRVF